jgi:hypothetical protein
VDVLSLVTLPPVFLGSEYADSTICFQMVLELDRKLIVEGVCVQKFIAEWVRFGCETVTIEELRRWRKGYMAIALSAGCSDDGF